METYFSCDIEADGPIPGPNSMLSIGCAAFNCEGELIDTFEANLKELPEASMNPKTKMFWDRNPEAWKVCRTNPEEPEIVMRNFHSWVTVTAQKHNARPVFVGYPTGFDFTFTYWYLIKFVGHSPFSFSALDMKTFAMFMMKCEFRKVTKSKMPDSWKTKRSHTHNALDDAIEQGEIFIKMMQEYRNTYEKA